MVDGNLNQIKQLLLQPAERKSVDEKFVKDFFSQLKAYTFLDGQLIEYISEGKLTTNSFQIQTCPFPIDIYNIWWKAASLETAFINTLISTIEDKMCTAKCTSYSINKLARHKFQHGYATLSNNYMEPIEDPITAERAKNTYMNMLRGKKYKKDTKEVKDTFFNRICHWNDGKESSNVLYAPFIYRNAKKACYFESRINTVFTSTNSRLKKQQDNLSNCLRAHMNLAQNFCTTFTNSSNTPKNDSITEQLVLNYQLESNYHVLFLPELLSARNKIIEIYPSINLNKLDNILIHSSCLPNVFSRHFFWKIVLGLAQELNVLDPLLITSNNLMYPENISKDEKIDLWLSIADGLINVFCKLVFPIGTSQLQSMELSIGTLSKYISESNLIFLGNIVLDSHNDICESYTNYFKKTEGNRRTVNDRQFVAACNDLASKLSQWHKKHINYCKDVTEKAEAYVQDPSTYDFIKMFYERLFWNKNTPLKPDTIFDLSKSNPYKSKKGNRIHSQYSKLYIDLLEKAQNEYYAKITQISFSILDRYERTKQQYGDNEASNQDP